MPPTFVMPGLVPGIHVFAAQGRKTWMAGDRRAEATPSFGLLCPAMTESEISGLPQPFSRQHLFQDPPADILVAEISVVPPPAIPLHLLGGRDEAVGDRGKVVIAKVQAEDQPAGSDPAQREPFGA